MDNEHNDMEELSLILMFVVLLVLAISLFVNI